MCIMYLIGDAKYMVRSSFFYVQYYTPKAPDKIVVSLHMEIVLEQSENFLTFLLHFALMKYSLFHIRNTSRFIPLTINFNIIFLNHNKKNATDKIILPVSDNQCDVNRRHNLIFSSTKTKIIFRSVN